MTTHASCDKPSVTACELVGAVAWRCHNCDALMRDPAEAAQHTHTPEIAALVASRARVAAARATAAAS